jgi:hypothetical protein
MIIHLEDSEEDKSSDINYKERFTKFNYKELTGHKKRVYTLDWNLNGSKLSSGSVDCSIRVIKFYNIACEIDMGFRIRKSPRNERP